MFPWVFLSRPVLNDLGNGAQTSSPERPCGSIIGFAVSKLFLDVDVRPKFSFAQFHLITAVIPLLCTPNNPPLSLLHVHSFLMLVNVFLAPLSHCQATECLPWFVKKLCSSSIHVCDSPLISSFFDQNFPDLWGSRTACCISYQTMLLRSSGHFSTAPWRMLLCTQPKIALLLLASKPHQESGGLMYYQGSHSVEPERRHTHLEVMIRHVNLAIFLFKSLF